MPKKKSPKPQKFRAVGAPEKWEQGDNMGVAQILERAEVNEKGISFKVGKRTYSGRPGGFWISERLKASELPSFLDWFNATLRIMYYRLTGKEMPPSQEIERLAKERDLLEKQLTETRAKLDFAEKQRIERGVFLELARKSSGELERFMQKFSELKQLVETSYLSQVGKEEDIKRLIKENSWLLGLDCYVEAKNKDVDTQTQIDLHIQTRYNQDRIFELKSPHLKPFIRKEDDPTRRLSISPELADGLSELIIYMRRTDIYSAMRTEGVYGIQRPWGVIVIGYKLEDTETEMLKNLNFHLRPHIQITTFDDVIENAQRELSLIETTQQMT